MKYETTPWQPVDDCMLAEPVAAYCGAEREVIEPWTTASAAEGVDGRFDRMMEAPQFRDAMLNWLDKSAATNEWRSHEDVWNELEQDLCGEAI